ncbi:MAG TPA: hypothetical protein VLC47_11595 [Burkholderiales bacterium]|nr:hypothetical protein [Burkholderiales bacterium]
MGCRRSWRRLASWADARRPNLLISDGSQFPSSGPENPILTIVALAIRQADSLAEHLSARSM